MIVPSDKVLQWASTAKRTVFLHVAGFLSKSGVMMGTVTAAAALAAWFLAGFLTRRLNRLSMEAEKIASGDWDTPIVVPKGEDEITVLARSMDSMRISLGEYVERISRNTAARVRMESEMEIAHRIQIGFLPHWDLFPDGQPVDVYAALSPARAVGGDLYDFCLRKGNQLVFVIGDVSGKGIPASLLMADVLSRFRSLVHTIETPSAILESLNNGLCANNPSGMFITLFCAMLDIEDGKVVFSNAGHNPPVLVSQKNGTDYLKPHNGLVLGGFPGMIYRNEELRLAPGDGIFLYTDGVTEARSEAGGLYTGERLLKRVEGLCKEKSREVVDWVMEDVRSFSEKVEQTDDIAMVMFRWTPVDGFHGACVEKTSQN
jgi:sigma-B regulation protein RsbU (phosphoserine phosphatase)